MKATQNRLLNLKDLRYSYSITPWSEKTIVPKVIEQVLYFFSQPLDYKNQYVQEVIEYGYRNQGHKESFAIRDPILPENLTICKSYIEIVHTLAIDCLRTIADELQLPEQCLLSLVEAQPFPLDRKSDSMLRIIYYHGNDVSEACSPHQDLGLLTLVLKSNTPALEIFKVHEQIEWINIESLMESFDVVVMVGETLAQISNQYYLPATHRVCATKEPRLALVYQLRANQSAILDSQQFETKVTGVFSNPFKMTAKKFLRQEMERRKSVNGSY